MLCARVSAGVTVCLQKHVLLSILLPLGGCQPPYLCLSAGFIKTCQKNSSQKKPAALEDPQALASCVNCVNLFKAKGPMNKPPNFCSVFWGIVEERFL